MPTISKRVTQEKPKFTFGVKEPPVPLQPQYIDDKPLKQSGFRKDIVSDYKRSALLPGKRISRNGKVYWETRKNRSDAFGKRV